MVLLMYQHFIEGLVYFILFLSVISTTGAQRTKEEWKSRVVYHILTDRFSPAKPTPATPCTDMRSWCGGNFRGIIDQLDYIQNLGANAIWISPIVLNTAGGYHGYWAKDLYQIDPHWGTEEDLKDLIAAAHQRDIWVMVDVVPNHMGYPPGCSWDVCPPETLEQYQEFVPFNQSEHFHIFCNTEDWNNQTQVEDCRLANLPDLNQTVPYVRETLLQWIRDLTATYQIDGYRIDTVKHISMDFWPSFQQAAGAYCIGEVWYEDAVDYPAKYTTDGGLDAVFNFPLYKQVGNIFQYRNSMRGLHENLLQSRDKYSDTHALGVFLDNHDVMRFLHRIPDKTMFYNALTLVAFWEGIPFLYYGTEQDFNGGNDPDNRESLWPHYDTNTASFQFIKEGLDYRKSVNDVIQGVDQENVYVDGESLVFSREPGPAPQVLVLVSNVGGSTSISNLNVPLSSAPDGTEYTNIRNPGDVLVVSGGMVIMEIYEGAPKVYNMSKIGVSSKASSFRYVIQRITSLWIMLGFYIMI